MEFSIPTNWQDDLLTGISAIKAEGKVKEIYGKLAFDDIGGGRIGFSLPFVSKKLASRHILRLQEMGFKFNYLLNAVCMDNLEFTRIGQARLRRQMDWLAKIGVNSVTVSNPYIIMWVKKEYPFMSITVSAIANTDSLNKAKFWEDLGVEKITFPGPSLNRNFALIKSLNNSINCKIQLIANNPCLLHCPTQNYHYSMNSHASQNWHQCRGFTLDYYVLMCRFRRLENITNFILSDWIRPEDINYYEGLGVDGIKLVDRRLSTDMILKIVKAYLDNSYKGNLVDLFPIFQGRTFNAHRRWLNKVFDLGSFLYTSPRKLTVYSRLMDKLEVFIDNESLNGFLENIPSECDLLSCDTCGYCGTVAKKAVKIDGKYLDKMLGLYRKALKYLF